MLGLFTTFIFIHTASTEQNITEVFGDQSRCFEHTDMCGEETTLGCLATHVVQHNATGLLAYYISAAGELFLGILKHNNLAFMFVLLYH